MDGARLGNAVARLGCTPAEATWKAGVDVLSFGGTKNGIMGGEAVVFFRPELAQDFLFLRKQYMQLASKMRFISAQFDALFTGDLVLGIEYPRQVQRGVEECWLIARRGDEQAVLELRRPGPVARRRGPTVGPDPAELPRAFVDHGLDRERHRQA